MAGWEPPSADEPNEVVEAVRRECARRRYHPSSSTGPAMFESRLRPAGQLWRVPHWRGCFCSHDFWKGVLNKVTVGVRLRELRPLLTPVHHVFRKTTALLPTVCRVVKGLNERLSLAADKLRFMTTRPLVILAKS